MAHTVGHHLNFHNKNYPRRPQPGWLLAGAAGRHAGRRGGPGGGPHYSGRGGAALGLRGVRGQCSIPSLPPERAMDRHAVLHIDMDCFCAFRNPAGCLAAGYVLNPSPTLSQIVRSSTTAWVSAVMNH
jgi:hypothetical protein